MSFFSKLKKIAPFVNKSVVIAGQAKDNPVGAALAVVEMIAESGEEPVTAVKAVAAAVDDHENRLVEQQKQIDQLLKDVKALKAKK